MHDRKPIREARAGGSPIRAIARELGVDRNTVRRAIVPGARGTYWRASATEAATEQVRDVLADYPNMAVRDVAVIIDWRHSRRALSNLVARLRPEYSTPSAIAARPSSTLQSGPLASRSVRAGTMTVGTMTVGRMT